MKPDYETYRDSEGVVHFCGPSLSVNAGICGNNDWSDGDPDTPANCRVCFAIVDYVHRHRKPTKSNGDPA